MKITRRQFRTLEHYYEIKVGVESIIKSLANLEYWAKESKEVVDELDKAKEILNNIKFEK